MIRDRALPAMEFGELIRSGNCTQAFQKRLRHAFDLVAATIIFEAQHCVGQAKTALRNDAAEPYPTAHAIQHAGFIIDLGP